MWTGSRREVSADPRVSLYVAECGPPDGRPLLVIHGGPDWDHSYLREPLDQLAGRYRLILPDLRGCGRSTCGLGDYHYTPGAAASDLAKLLDVLGIARADVLGFSYGGRLAQWLALAVPGRVRRLIIASSTILPVPPDAFLGWAERDRRLAAGANVWSGPEPLSPELTRADALASAPANVWRREALPEYLARLERVRFSAEWARPWLAGTLPSAQCEDAGPRLAALGISILLLHGRFDMTFPAALAEQAAGLIPAAQAIVLDQAGHMAHIDQPECWLMAIGEFLSG